MRCVLTIAIFQLAIMDSCYAASGIIWRKREQKFVQLFTIPQFAALQEARMAESRALEFLDMRNETIKAVYYEEKNMVMFHDNDTRVNGICGELWYLLADYLNFTFIPIKTTDRTFGGKQENGTLSGMVDMIAKNKTDVILRTGYFQPRMEFVDYTVPLWKSRFHIYILPQQIFDNKWMFTLFSPETWYFIVFLFIVLSGVSYFLQKLPRNQKRKKKSSQEDFTVNDHFFYSFAMISGQGYVPEAYHNKFKILSLSKSIFGWLVLLSFSSLLIHRMAHRQTILPFKDLDTLFNNTKYILLSYSGSFFTSYLKQKFNNEVADTILHKRVQFIDIAEDLHNTICNDMEKYAMFEIEDRFKAINRRGCPLQPTGNYNETWITFAIKKNFRYKRSIDSALVKITEVGLLDALRDRWLDVRQENKNPVKFKMIDLHQVYLIFLMLCYGTIISFAILVAEIITYRYETKNAPRKRRRRNLRNLTNFSR